VRVEAGLTPVLARVIALPLIALTIAALGGCGPAADDPASGPVTVYVSAPLRGEDADDGRDVADGARLALDEAGAMAGDVEVGLEVLDAADGPGNVSGWGPGAVGRNARAAAQDTAAIAYIGDLQSGATRVSLPITNGALVPQVSPGATALDLVTPPDGSTDVPEEVQPSGERTFARVIPDDGVQAEAAAAWAKELGAREVVVAGDGSEFGETMVEEFSEAAQGMGWATRSETPGAIEAVDFAYVVTGEPIIVNGGLQRVVEAAQAPHELSGAGPAFVDAFESEYDREPGPYAAYGYESMALVLDAIERAGDEGEDRQAVRDELFATVDRESILGTYSITPIGNTTLDRLAGYRIEGGEPVFEEALTAP
jgi:branched-chain amino acid transport system substrate-binding protein